MSRYVHVCIFHPYKMNDIPIGVCVEIESRETEENKLMEIQFHSKLNDHDHSVSLFISYLDTLAIHLELISIFVVAAVAIATIITLK